MTKLYVMNNSHDCRQAIKMYEHNKDYEIIDISHDINSLKEYMIIRDSHPAFSEIREQGKVGIPCIVKEDNSVILLTKLPQQIAELTEDTYTEIEYTIIKKIQCYEKTLLGKDNPIKRIFVTINDERTLPVENVDFGSSTPLIRMARTMFGVTCLDVILSAFLGCSVRMIVQDEILQTIHIDNIDNKQIDDALKQYQKYNTIDFD